MQILSVSNPVWSDEAKTTIILAVFLSDEPTTPSKMVVRANAHEDYIRDLFSATLGGQFGPIAPYEAPPVVYPDLTARQLRLGLLGAGITPAMVDQVIGQLPSPQKEAAQIEWEYANVYNRDHPLVLQIAPAFNLTTDQVNQLWLAAAQL